jgi:myo-inositol-1-phosphate synthase
MVKAKSLARVVVISGVEGSVGFYMPAQIEMSIKGALLLPKTKVALIGVGNCASALIQGIQYYGKAENEKDYIGIRNASLGGLTPKDIQFVAAFDVDEFKVGKDISEAIFAKPNNAPKVADVPKTGVVVQKGAQLDGFGEATQRVVIVSKEPEVDVEDILKKSGAEVVLNLLPSGAAKASDWYAEQALAAGCGFVNATPNFIASNTKWAAKFQAAGLPLVGDDLVDQIGSTALHKTLLELLSKSGAQITETYQLDVGGGTESLDTMDRTREMKRAIKTASVASSLPYKTEVVAGSTDYVDFLENKRDSYFWISGVYFCNAPMRIDLKFSTVDAPNAGSVLFDILRAMKLALNKKRKGAIEPLCAYGFKHPPKIMKLEAAEEAFAKFVKENS